MCVCAIIFAADLMFHLCHWPGGPVTSGGKDMPADRATSLKCDNAGHWITVGVMVTRSLSTAADQLWLTRSYSNSGIYVDYLFKHGIPGTHDVLRKHS